MAESILTHEETPHHFDDSGTAPPAGAVGFGFWKWKFPYGNSHCCIIGMMFALEQYANDNGGKYPAGESTPEASLSLLYKGELIDPYTLRGMTVRESAARQILEAGQLLGPESCGWHYVEGLTLADDTGLALLWCREPLGHNGQRTKGGGRQVVFIGGNIEWISGAKWDAFLADQEQLLSQRTDRARAGSALVQAVIELPDGRRVEALDGDYTMREESKGESSSGSGTQSGGGINQSTITWYHPPVENGYVTRTLSISNLVSDPVTVTFINGKPDQTNVIFKMKNR